MVFLKVPDRLSILTYVSQYYNYFHGRSPIGGMAGVKRAPSESSEEPKGKKAVSQADKPASLDPMQPLAPVRTNPIVQEKNTVTEFPPAKPGRVPTGGDSPRGSRSSICAICKKHVHLVQRYLVDGKLYHRNCFRCKQCSSTLHSGAYKSTGEPGIFVCMNHHTKASIPHSKSPHPDRKQPAAGYASRTNPVPMDTASPGVLRRAQEPDKLREVGQNTSQPSREPVRNSPAKGLAQSSGWNSSSVGSSAMNSLSPSSPALQKSPSSTSSSPNPFLTRFTQNSPVGGKPSVTNNSPVGWSPAPRKSEPLTTPSKLDLHTTSPQGKFSAGATTQSPPSAGASPRGKSDSQATAQSITSQMKSDFRALPQSQANSHIATSEHRLDLGSSSSPNSWTSCASKTQQAREKFFQPSCTSADKPPASKEYGLTFTSPQAAGKAPSGATVAPGQAVQERTKDKARSFLIQNLKAGLASNGPGSTAAQGPTRSSPTPSHAPTPDSKPDGLRGVSKAKVEPASPRPGTMMELSSKSKPSTPASPQRVKKSPTFSRPSQELLNPRQKPDTSGVNGQGPRSTENQIEDPAAWRSKLKPVEKISSVDKVSEQKEKVTPTPIDTKGLALSKKPLENSSTSIEITLSSPLKDKASTSASALPSKSQASVPAPQGRKKLSISPNLDVSDSWMKLEHKRDDATPPEKPSRLSKIEKPYIPTSFPISSNKEVKSPVKLHPDYIPEEEIQKKIQDIEKELDSLELKGIDLEKKLREAEGDESEDALMVEWFKLIHEKQLLLRQESELMYKAKEQRLEEMQLDIADELRRLMEKPEALKTPREKKREQDLLEQYVNTVNDRSDIVDSLDEDRLREQEEDQVIQDMIQKLDLQKEGAEKKKPKTGRLSKIWRQKNKGKTSE
uniref:MICAL like 2 n=2 Tax=Monodelphis domestica TaxID=13616 RepID=F7CUR5_MONDO